MSVALDTIAPPLLSSKEIRWSEKSRSLLIRKRAIEFTQTECRLFSLLVPGEPITYDGMAERVYGCLVDSKVRIMLDKHIDRIRGKLRGSGVYIYCILGYGYMLLP